MLKPEGDPRIKEVFIEDNPGNNEVFWQKVDAALAQGHKVWVRSPLLNCLSGSFGCVNNGKAWLPIFSPPQRSLSLAQRLRDLAIAIPMLAITWPLMLVIAAWIKISSPGPVFYTCQVVGNGGKLIKWRKFRSMKVVPESENVAKRRLAFQAYVEMSGDPQRCKEVPKKVIDNARVTPVGRFLRKYSLDELPQFWNILVGEISLVGPRPCLPYEAEFFTGWRQKRFEVPGGLTGLWQVFGRGQVGFNEWVALDTYYAYRRSFMFDLYLIFKTIGAVLEGRGAK